MQQQLKQRRQPYTPLSRGAPCQNRGATMPRAPDALLVTHCGVVDSSSSRSLPRRRRLLNGLPHACLRQNQMPTNATARKIGRARPLQVHERIRKMLSECYTYKLGHKLLDGTYVWSQMYQVLLFVFCKESNDKSARVDLRRAKFKFPGRQKIIKSRKWGFIKFNRTNHIRYKVHRVESWPDGVNAKVCFATLSILLPDQLQKHVYVVS